MADRYFSDAFLAGLYDAFCPRERRTDFDFYLPMIMDSEAVLDVGCGTGAMLHEARDAGHRGRLWGLDPGEGMIEQARRRTDIEWTLGDIGSSRWSGMFDLVVMTGHAFQALVSDEDVRTALATIRAALTDGGRFAFETRNPLAREWESWTPDRSATAVAPGGEEVRMVRNVERVEGETVTFTHTFTSEAWSHAEVSRSTLRFMGAERLAGLLAEAGMAIEALFGDWDRSPLTDDSPEIIVIARAG